MKILIQFAAIIVCTTLAAHSIEAGDLVSAGFRFGVAMGCCVILKSTLDNQRGE